MDIITVIDVTGRLCPWCQEPVNDHENYEWAMCSKAIATALAIANNGR